MNRRLKRVLVLSLYFLLILVFVLLLVKFVGQKIQVNGTSMSPTLDDKDQLLVDKISYRFSDPDRFDIIVFPYKYEKDTYYIKRIIGLPNETVFIDSEGKIYINGELLEEGYGKEIIIDPGRAYEEIQLAEDEYFVLGDNRNNSSDSRDPNIGNIKRDQIMGRAFMRVYPFNKLGMIKHK
ncbi:MAG: signal peptidase I [Lachnospiraceae bacterium]|nr:signal peptidase I [Lachnospiraceae bacterium]